MSHGCLNGWQSIKIHAKCNVNLRNGITNGDKSLSGETLTRRGTPIFIQRASLRQRKKSFRLRNSGIIQRCTRCLKTSALPLLDRSIVLLALYCSRWFQGFLADSSTSWLFQLPNRAAAKTLELKEHDGEQYSFIMAKYPLGNNIERAPLAFREYFLLT